MPVVEVEVVEPGSANDPFAPKNVDLSKPADGTPPAAPVAPAPKVEGEPAPGTTAAAPVVTPAPEAGKTAPPATDAPATLDAAAVQKMIDDKLRDQQSGYDRRINVLSTQLDTERSKAAEAERAHELELRQLRLADSTITAEEKARLQGEWNLADQEARLTAWQTELEGFHSQLTVASLVEEFGAYGVKPEDLEALKTPEEMEAHCLETKANALEAQIKAGVTPATAAAPAPATPAPAAPAGVTQTSDVGGGGGAPHTEKQMVTEPGIDNLAKNIANSGWSSVKLPY